MTRASLGSVRGEFSLENSRSTERKRSGVSAQNLENFNVLDTRFVSVGPQENKHGPVKEPIFPTADKLNLLEFLK